VKWFKALLQAKRPDVQFVAEQWPALGRIDAGATVAALAAERPEAIYNVTFGPDLTNFVRQGNSRGLFERRSVVSMLTGEPEYLDPLGDETPEGWIVTGYPWDQINTPAHSAFLAAYRAKFNDYPRLGSIVGFATFHSIAAGLKRAGSLETDRMIAAFRGLSFETPMGPAMYRAIDHQSTLGAYVGKLALANGKGRMVDWRYADGANYLPPDAEVAAMRPADARA
jgi:branched-chain amino acid transport system substrate-binding protein